MIHIHTVQNQFRIYLNIFEYIGHKYLFGHSFVSIFWYKYILTFKNCLYEYIRTFVRECARVWKLFANCKIWLVCRNHVRIYKNGICTDNLTRWTLLSDRRLIFLPSWNAGWCLCSVTLDCLLYKLCQTDWAVLRVNRKYIDYCLEEIEGLWRQRGIVGFSENGRRLGADICIVHPDALWDLTMSAHRHSTRHTWTHSKGQGCISWPEWLISFPYLGVAKLLKGLTTGSSKLSSCENKRARPGLVCIVWLTFKF